MSKTENTRQEAYRAGWDAADSATFLIDAALDRFTRRNGDAHADAFQSGWYDRTGGDPYGYTFWE